jgi:hypothetical protein
MFFSQIRTSAIKGKCIFIVHKSYHILHVPVLLILIRPAWALRLFITIKLRFTYNSLFKK